jgi:hypothetical protein
MSTAAANHSLQQNAELRRQRPFIQEADHSWGPRPGIDDSADEATRQRLREQYQAEFRADRRIRRIGTVVGFVAALLLAYFALA